MSISDIDQDDHHLLGVAPQKQTRACFRVGQHIETRRGGGGGGGVLCCEHICGGQPLQLPAHKPGIYSGLGHKVLVGAFLCDNPLVHDSYAVGVFHSGKPDEEKQKQYTKGQKRR